MEKDVIFLDGKTECKDVNFFLEGASHSTTSSQWAIRSHGCPSHPDSVPHRHSVQTRRWASGEDTSPLIRGNMSREGETRKTGWLLQVMEVDHHLNQASCGQSQAFKREPKDFPGGPSHLPQGPPKSETIKHWKYMKNFLSIKEKFGDLPGGPVANTSTFNTGGVGLIPGQGTKIPQASWPKKHKTEAIL